MLCLDEPTVGLDADCLRQVAVVLGQISAEGGAVLLASHDSDFVKAVATRVVTLRAGHIVNDTAQQEGVA